MARTGWRGYQDHRETEERQERMELLEYKDWWESRDPKEIRGPMACRDIKGHLENRAILDFRVPRDPGEGEDQQGQWDNLERSGHREAGDLLEKLVIRELLENKDLWACVAAGDRGVRLENLEVWDPKVFQDWRENRVHPAHPVLPGHLVKLCLWRQVEWSVRLWVVSQGRWVRWGLPAHLGREEQEVVEDRPGGGGCRDHQVHQEDLADRDCLEGREIRENRENPEDRGANTLKMT